MTSIHHTATPAGGPTTLPHDLRDLRAVAGWGAAHIAEEEEQTDTRFFHRFFRRSNHDTTRHETAVSLDLDCAVFMLDAHGKLPADEYFVFYNNPMSPDGAVQLLADDLGAAADYDGDGDALLIHLDRVAGKINELEFTISIYQGGNNQRFNLGQVEDIHLSLYDTSGGQTPGRLIGRIDLQGDQHTNTGAVLARLRRTDTGWQLLPAHADGEPGGLQALAERHI